MIPSKRFRAALLIGSLVMLTVSHAKGDSLEEVADDFWGWRAKYAPFTGDDVNRVERPGGMRSWSKASIELRRKNLAEFEARWKKLNPAQ